MSTCCAAWAALALCCHPGPRAALFFFGVLVYVLKVGCLSLSCSCAGAI